MSPPSSSLIKGLFKSFEGLEQAILAARQLISDRHGPESELLARLDSYQEALDKQKQLALTLCGHAALGDWSQVSRHIEIITKLSQMIRDDALEILAERSKVAAGTQNPKPHRESIQ